MKSTKNTKSAKPATTSVDVHVRHRNTNRIVDILCNPKTDDKLYEVARLALYELCKWFLIKPGVSAWEDTPEARRAAKRCYTQAVTEAAKLEHQLAPEALLEPTCSPMQMTPQHYTRDAVIAQVAAELERLLNHLHVITAPDDEKGRWSPNARSYADSVDYAILHRFKELQHMRHLIEEFGESKVVRGAERKAEVLQKAAKEIERQANRRDLRDFIQRKPLEVILREITRQPLFPEEKPKNLCHDGI